MCKAKQYIYVAFLLPFFFVLFNIVLVSFTCACRRPATTPDIYFNMLVREREPGALLALPPQVPGLLTRARFLELRAACREALADPPRRRRRTGERGYYNVPTEPLREAGLLRALKSEVLTARPGANKQQQQQRRQQRPGRRRPGPPPVPLFHASSVGAGYLCLPRHVGRALFGEPDADRRAAGDPLPGTCNFWVQCAQPLCQKKNCQISGI